MKRFEEQFPAPRAIFVEVEPRSGRIEQLLKDFGETQPDGLFFSVKLPVTAAKYGRRLGEALALTQEHGLWAGIHIGDNGVEATKALSLADAIGVGGVWIDGLGLGETPNLADERPLLFGTHRACYEMLPTDSAAKLSLATAILDLLVVQSTRVGSYEDSYVSYDPIYPVSLEHLQWVREHIAPVPVATTDGVISHNSSLDYLTDILGATRAVIVPATVGTEAVLKQLIERVRSWKPSS